MKKELEKYKNDALSNADTEGVENKILTAIITEEQRQKWSTLLTENGIERTLKTNVNALKTVSIWRYAIGIAASVLIVAGIWWTNSDNSSSVDTLTDRYLTDYFADPTTRSSTSSDNEAWATAKKAYSQHQFEIVAQNIEALPNPNDEQIFYKSLSYLYQKSPDFDKSSAGFTQLMQKNDNYSHEAQWYYALLLIKQHKTSEAISTLNEVIQKQNFYSKKAQELKNKIEK